MNNEQINKVLNNKGKEVIEKALSNKKKSIERIKEFTKNYTYSFIDNDEDGKMKPQIIKTFKQRNIRHNNILLVEELTDHYLICYDFDIQGKKDVKGKNYYFLKKEDVDDDY